MEHPDFQNLKYGIIYLYSDRGLLQGRHEPEMVIEKFVYPMQVEWIDEPGRKDLFIIARRFNVGNIGRYATVSLSLSRMNRSGGWFEAIRHFADALMGISDEGDGDIELNEEDYGYHYYDQASVFGEAREAAPQDKTRVEPSLMSGRLRRFQNRLRNLIKEQGSKNVIGSSSMTRPHYEIDEPERDLLQENENEEVLKLERERKEALERIKRAVVSYIAQYHDDPKDLMAQLLRGKVVVGQPGRVLVNGDMRIVLPDYDEMEIEMPALCRVLYILFMKMRKQGGGIILRNIDEYRSDILDIYSLVKPGANESRVMKTVDNLCDPYGDSLNQAISRVNRCIKNAIVDKQLAKDYMITGRRGEPYSIGLSPEYLELPRAVTSD